MPNQIQNESKLNHSSAGDPAISRRSLVRILLIHSDTLGVERCLQACKNSQFYVEADVVVSPERFAARLDSKRYDVVLAQYPNPYFQDAINRLAQARRPIPVIFLVETVGREILGEVIPKPALDCVDTENIGHLPVVIRRILSERKLRSQRDRAENKLRRSEARYRALAGNLRYGICRWNMEGKLLDVNPALVTMLGYESRKALMAEDLTRAVFQDPAIRKQILEGSGLENQVRLSEIDWKRRDGTSIKVRLSGREIESERGKIEGYEVIVEDVTSQRELENSLRDQATKDSLTGLANYCRFIDVLDSEIKRSTRTGRQFALLLFDLDRLKYINDRFGHVTGSRALCRLADTLSITCRDIDTAARFGGDEFALVLPETGAEAAEVVARRICNTLAADGRDPKISVSVGAAIYPTDGESIETLLSVADIALYKTKASLNGFTAQFSSEELVASQREMSRSDT